VNQATALGKTIREYQIPVSIVDTDDESYLRDIFDRLNTFGRRLTRAEVFQALHTALGEGEPADLRALVDEVGEFGFGDLRDDTVLRVVLAVRGGDVFRDFHDEFSDGVDPATTYRSAAAGILATVRFLQTKASIPHVRALPYAFVVPVLARFFYLHPEPSARTLVLLRRWVWRGALAGIGGGSGATAVLRRAVQAVDTDETRSAARLLGLVSRSTAEPLDLSAIQLNRAAARISLALLSSLGPRDFRTGEPIDLPLLLDRADEAESLLRITPQSGRVRSLASVFLHEALTDDETFDTIASAAPEVLQSHAISPEARDALFGSAGDSFLQLRERDLRLLLEGRRLALAEPDANDRPALASLLVPDSPSETPTQ
jgi:hypothetical protein